MFSFTLLNFNTFGEFILFFIFDSYSNVAEINFIICFYHLTPANGERM